MESKDQKAGTPTLSLWAKACSIAGAGVAGGMACPLVLGLWVNAASELTGSDSSSRDSRDTDYLYRFG